jgi:diguanylate cyclase (GGDEF)-like protein
MLIDLDNFGDVNRRHGHETGDRILAEIGLLFQKHVRSSDQACRFGGQQFAVLMVNIGSTEADGICDRFRQMLAEHPFNADAAPIHITASIGFVSCDSGPKITAQEIMQRADHALTQAKEAGKNCTEGVCVEEWTG